MAYAFIRDRVISLRIRDGEQRRRLVACRSILHRETNISTRQMKKMCALRDRENEEWMNEEKKSGERSKDSLKNVKTHISLLNCRSLAKRSVCAIPSIFFFVYRCKRIALTQVWQWLVCAVKLKWMRMRTRKVEKVWLKLASACIRENR